MKAIPSISVQILLVVLFTVVSVLGVYSIIEINVFKQRETRSLQRVGTLTTDRIANSLAYPLWNLNREETERVVLDEMGSSYVFRVQVFDENGDLYVGKVRGADGAVRNIDATNAGAAIAPPARLYSYNRPINFRDNAIGRVAIDVTDANLLAQRRDLRWGLAIKLLLLAVVLSVVLFVALRGLVVRPLSTLKLWVEDVPSKSGRRPPRFRYSGEINSLAEAFGEMSVNLQDKNEGLKKSSEEIRDLYNGAPCGYHSLDANEVYVQVNDTELGWLGRTREEVIGKLRFGDVLTDVARETLREAYAEFIRQGFCRDLEYQIVARDGTVRSVLLSATAVYDDAGNFVMSRATLYDITERQEAESRANRLAYFLSKMREAVIVSDFDHRFIYWNEGAEHTFGWTAAEAIGKTADELFPDGPLAELEAPRRAIAATGEWHGELPNMDKNGRAFFTESSWTLVRDAAGQPEAIISISSDITERKQAETALRASEKRFGDIFNLSPYRMGIVRRCDGIILAVNDCWVRANGIPREEAVNHSIFEWLSRIGPEMAVGLQQILEEGKPFSDRMLRFKNILGEEQVTLTSGALIEIDGESCFLWASNDITARERAEQALRESEEIFRTLAETVSAGIFIYRDAKFVYANPAAERLTGYANEEFLTMDIMELIHPDFHQTVKDRIEARERGAPAANHFEDKIVTKGGEERWMDVSSASTSFLGRPAVIVTTFDITERKRAEEALQASEKRFSIAFNSSPMPAGISMIESGRFLAVNDQFVALTGYSREEVVGRTALELGLSPVSEKRELVIRTLNKEGRVRDFEGRLITRNGDELVMLYSIERIELEGEPCLLQAGIDITLRKRTEEALQASEKRFSIAFNANPLMATISTLDGGRFLAVNDAFIALTGYGREEAVGSTALELNLWTVADNRLHLMEELDSQGRVRSFEAKLRMKDGTERILLVSIEKIELEGQTCLLHSGNDITERQRAELTLRESEQRFKLASRATSDVIYDWDFKSGFLWWSESLKQGIFGYLPYQIRYEFAWWEERVHPEDRDALVAKLNTAVLGTGQEWEAEYRFRCADGAYAYIYERGFIVRDHDGNPQRMVGSMMDITERQQAEAQLIASREQMRALSERLRRAKEEEGIRIARELHDELGSMLTGLKWDLEKMDKTLSKSDNGTPVTVLRKRIGTMTSLIEATINTVRRISAELRPGMLDHLGLVAALEWQAQQFQERTGIECSWSTELETADLPRESETAVFRIFQEILTNVLRHSGATRVRVALDKNDGHLDLLVSDNGRGISEGEKGNTRSLGLLGMKERALLVGGEVTIEGAPGAGTSVMVRVPAMFPVALENL